MIINFSRTIRRAAAQVLMTVATGCIASAAVAAHTTVPVQFIDGLPVVTVTLGDLRADFLVDTGGEIGITVPQPLAVTAAEVTLSADFEKREDAAGHMASVQKLTARSVVVGGAELGPVEGLVNYQWGLSVGEEAAPAVTKKGVIGFKALSAKNILFDFPHNALVLFDRHEGDSPDVAGWEKTPFEYDARGVIVRIQVDGIDAALSFDTAATTSMIKKNALLFSKHKSPCAKKEADEQFCGILNLEAKANGASLGRMQFAVVQMGDIPFERAWVIPRETRLLDLREEVRQRSRNRLGVTVLQKRSMYGLCRSVAGFRLDS